MEKFRHIPGEENKSNSTVHFSFSEVRIHEIRKAIPKGYMIMTLAESRRRYESDNTFKTDAENMGRMWVLGTKDGKEYPVQVRAYYGLFRTDNTAYSEDDRSMRAHCRTNNIPARVAYVRDEKVPISRQDELMVILKDAFRRNIQPFLSN